MKVNKAYAATGQRVRIDEGDDLLVGRRNRVREPA